MRFRAPRIVLEFAGTLNQECNTSLFLILFSCFLSNISWNPFSFSLFTSVCPSHAITVFFFEEGIYEFFFFCHSAGKSIVAEILMLRRVITTGKIALLVLPYVSICAEKVIFLSSFRLQFKYYVLGC